MKMYPGNESLLQFDNLSGYSAIQHFCTTRKGGVSKGLFSSFNLGNFSDDSPMDIDENREILSRMWYMEIDDFIIPHQTHGNNVFVIDDAFMHLSQSDKIEALYGVDATITHRKDIFLCATTADCAPILLYDNFKQIIAAIHAGWKGIVGGIIDNTISKMIETYYSNPKDIIAAIGPSISQENYEVGEDLINEFEKAGFDLSSASIINPVTSKNHIDLATIINNELVRLGVSHEHIETTSLCTYHCSDLFFSARRQSINCGRMLSGIKLVD